MKKKHRFLILLLISSLFLSACDESGFSSSGSSNNNYQQNNTSEYEEDDQQYSGTAGGSNGSSNNDHNNDKQDDENTNSNNQTTDDNTQTSTIDLSNRILVFRPLSINVEEELYIDVQFDNNPFSEQYDFAYYTVNEKQLEIEEFYFKNEIDGQNYYKMYLGNLVSGTYLIKFYNSSNKQYGQSSIKIKVKNSVNNVSYFAVAINLIEVRFITIGFTIQNYFKKIGDFFSNMFNNQKINY